MKVTTKITMLFIALFISAGIMAQEKPASPAAVATGKAAGANITINYSSPSVKGRTIWGELVPYSKVWRAGANEATTFKTDKDIMVEGQKLPAGDYAFFVIPEKDNTATIVFNKEAKQWGAYKYDESKDQLRVKVKTKKSSTLNERLVYTVNKNNVILSWEYLEIPISIK
ncbi:DUF2911 domain-containing protein [Flavobacterium rhizosphaerae]|uniref:DUF2911 domain-containing protein n=1 Tax=Flavobacterium rhizosphaerae TaxID=3163298 RepID=A0ABW8YZI6_9FLAO